MFINIVLFLIHVDKLDENVQANLVCSSQENTDSDSDGEIEVLDSTVTKEQPNAPNNAPNRDITKSLARLFEEAWRATEKSAKKTVPKEEGNGP